MRAMSLASSLGEADSRRLYPTAPCSLNWFSFGWESASFSSLLQHVPEQEVGVIIRRPEIGKLVEIVDRRDSLLLDQRLKDGCHIFSTKILFDILLLIG